MGNVLYTSDMHGNEAQFRALVDYALQVKPEVVIIGGELPPKGGFTITDDYPSMQRKFLGDKLPKLLILIRTQLPQTPIYLMPGNDDCEVNDDVLNSHPDLFTNIDRKKLVLPSGLEIVGYSAVPITPFGIKDREKFDLTDVPANLASEYKARQEKTYNLRGLRSTPQFGWERVLFTESDRTNSIQHDLKSKLFTENSQNTIYVFHTPANNTSLDITEDNAHVGSFAVREFIERYQPHLTLHGHIHETVDMSGNYKEQIGKSLGMSAGNHNEDSKLAVLVFDAKNPKISERIRLPCTKFGKIFGKLF